MGWGGGMLCLFNWIAAQGMQMALGSANRITRGHIQEGSDKAASHFTVMVVQIRPAI
jgi:hypothetical protein